MRTELIFLLKFFGRDVWNSNHKAPQWVISLILKTNGKTSDIWKEIEVIQEYKGEDSEINPSRYTIWFLKKESKT
jgi:hypothetical protein